MLYLNYTMTVPCIRKISSDGVKFLKDVLSRISLFLQTARVIFQSWFLNFDRKVSEYLIVLRLF